MVVSAAGDDVRMRFRLGEGGGGEDEGWHWGGGIQRSAWVIGVVVVRSSKVKISGTPTLLLFDLHSQ